MAENKQEEKAQININPDQLPNKGYTVNIGKVLRKGGELHPEDYHGTGGKPIIRNSPPKLINSDGKPMNGK